MRPKITIQSMGSAFEYLQRCRREDHYGSQGNSRNKKKRTLFSNESQMFEKRSIEANVKNFIHSKNYDLSGNTFAFTREILQDFLTSYYELVPSMQILTEAIMYSRGKQMELSDPSEFNLQKLISWLHQNLPALTNLERLKKQRRASSNVRQGISVWNAKSDK